MSSHDDYDDLMPEEQTGYKVGEKKTLDEYTKLDAEDESLAKWKLSLGLGTGDLLPVDPKDKRRVVILSMTLLIEGDSPIVVDLSKFVDEKELKERKISFKIKEKSIYSLKIKFKVQHELVTGLKYLQLVKKAGITVDKTEESCGSYLPNTNTTPFYEVQLSENEAPSGLLARGSYSAVSKFIDDDKATHLVVPWNFQITK